METHQGYLSLRLAKEEKLPPQNTRLRKAYDCCELFLRQHFTEFNKLQEVYFSTVIGPRLLFLLQCPVVTEKGTLHTDWEKMSKMVEQGLDRLARMANTDQKPPSKDAWIKMVSRDD
jgi:hypothetical protein